MKEHATLTKLKRCPTCGEMTLGIQVVKDYEYRTPMGIVVIEGDSRLEECRSCREVFVPGDLIDRWNRLVLESISKKVGVISAVELQFSFSVLPYSQNELAKAVGKERSTLTRYKTGENPVDPLFDDTLKQIIGDFLAGTETTIERLRSRATFVPHDETVRRLKVR